MRIKYYAALQIFCLCIFLSCLTSRNNQARLDINWYITTKLWHWARLNPCKITPNRKKKEKRILFFFFPVCLRLFQCSYFMLHPTVCDYEDNKAGKNQRVKIQFPQTNISFSFFAKLFPQKTNIKYINCWIRFFHKLNV